MIFTAGTGSNYDFKLNGTSVQDGAGDTYTTSALSDGDEVKVIVSNAAGCVDSSAAIATTVNALPTVSLTSDATANTICAGEEVIFTAGTGSNYEFKLNGTSVQNGAGDTYTTSALSDGDAVKVIVSNASGCVDSSAAIATTVNALPVTSAITGSATPACGASGEPYSVTETVGSSYAWTLPTGSSIASGAGTHSITVDLGTDNGDISVVETSSDGCDGAQVDLTISMLGCGLTAAFSADETTICNGDTVVFTNNSAGTSGSTTYAWDFGTGATPATATGEGPHSVVYTTDGTATVSLTITEGASDTRQKLIILQSTLYQR